MCLEEIVSKSPHTVCPLSITASRASDQLNTHEKIKTLRRRLFQTRRVHDQSKTRKCSSSSIECWRRLSLTLALFFHFVCVAFFAPKHPSTPRRVQSRLREHHYRRRVWSKQRDGRNGPRAKKFFLFFSYRYQRSGAMCCPVIYSKASVV